MQLALIIHTQLNNKQWKINNGVAKIIHKNVCRKTDYEFK